MSGLEVMVTNTEEAARLMQRVPRRGCRAMRMYGVVLLLAVHWVPLLSVAEGAIALVTVGPRGCSFGVLSRMLSRIYAGYRVKEGVRLVVQVWSGEMLQVSV